MIGGKGEWKIVSWREERSRMAFAIVKAVLSLSKAKVNEDIESTGLH